MSSSSLVKLVQQLLQAQASHRFTRARFQLLDATKKYAKLFPQLSLLIGNSCPGELSMLTGNSF
jgi:hypothetical protein